MRITTVQTYLLWEDIKANLKHFSELLEKLPENSTDLIVLPEMFSTGFTMSTTKVAETEKGAALSWMKQIANSKKCAITGSLIIEENKKYYNRLFFVYPDGSYKFYDKKHLFTMANEHLHFSAGNEKIYTKIKDFNILPIICYDLRFPLWCRNKYEAKNNTYQYDVMIVVANWPEARIDAWSTLLKARAIENQCYVVGVNRIGADGNGIAFCGGTAIFDAKGKEVYAATDNTEAIHTTEIDFDSLEGFREKFPVLKDV